MFVIKVNPVLNVFDGMSKDTLSLSNTGVSSVVVVVFCTHKHAGNQVYSMLFHPFNEHVFRHILD